MKVLMVCLGNICRSPLAEGILKHKLKNKDVFVDSCGTGNYNIGESPDHRSIEIGFKNSIDISTQRARQLNIDDFKNFDIIYAMDKSVFKDILDKCPDEKYIKKINIITPKGIPDPYYENNEAFKNIFDMLDMACDEISNKIIKKC